MLKWHYLHTQFGLMRAVQFTGLGHTGYRMDQEIRLTNGTLWPIPIVLTTHSAKVIHIE